MTSPYPHEAGNAVMTRRIGGSPLRDQAPTIAQRTRPRKARDAPASKRAVVLHAMRRSGRPFAACAPACDNRITRPSAADGTEMRPARTHGADENMSLGAARAVRHLDPSGPERRDAASCRRPRRAPRSQTLHPRPGRRHARPRRLETAAGPCRARSSRPSPSHRATGKVASPRPITPGTAHVSTDVQPNRGLARRDRASSRRASGLRSGGGSRRTARECSRRGQCGAVSPVAFARDTQGDAPSETSPVPIATVAPPACRAPISREGMLRDVRPAPLPAAACYQRAVIGTHGSGRAARWS